jgi:hypothetical protein
LNNLGYYFTCNIRLGFIGHDFHIYSLSMKGNQESSFLLREDLSNPIRRRLGMGMHARTRTAGCCAGGILRAGVDIAAAQDAGAGGILSVVGLVTADRVGAGGGAGGAGVLVDEVVSEGVDVLTDAFGCVLCVRGLV